MSNLHNKKSVLYIGGFELPDKNAAAQRVVANAKILKSLGYSVNFLGFDKSIENETSIDDSKKEYEGFFYYNIKYPRSLLDWIKYIFSIKYIIRLNCLKPTHIIAYNYPSIALYRLRNYCVKNRISLIADCTEWEEVIGGSYLFKIVKKIDIHLRMTKIHPLLDGIIVISRFLNVYYSNYKIDILQLPPLVDLSMRKWSQSVKIQNDQLILIYAGSPGNGQKDRLDKIIEAISIIKNTTNLTVKLRVLGLTKHEYISSFGIDSFPNNIEDIIFFLGKVSHIDVLKEIKNADFEIFIRDNNLKNKAGFPTKFVESISCGTPVLTNLTSNLDEYLISGKNGLLIDISSTDSLVRSIYDSISCDKEVIREMKLYCQSSYLFDYNNYVNDFKLFLEKLNRCI